VGWSDFLESAAGPRETGGPPGGRQRQSPWFSAKFGIVRGMDIVNHRDTVPFTTADGSTIRELLAHRNSAIRQQSLAEARLMPGCATVPHHHAVTEEIYYILTGTASMTLGDETRDVGPGDAIAIPPGIRHTIRNTGSQELVFLCTCAPGYEHTDTFLEPPTHS
jgi:mannose-6-phosphate isomerase-like protein (cupin superfamily)